MSNHNTPKANSSRQDVFISPPTPTHRNTGTNTSIAPPTPTNRDNGQGHGHVANRDETQQKAFLRWANIVLAKHPDNIPPIENLVDSIKDGITLGRLAEAVIPTKLKLPAAKNDLIRVQNITTALNSFEAAGLRLVNIHSTSITRGDPKAILGLMFQLCIHFQVQSTDSNGKAISVAQLKAKLVEWINSVLAGLDPNDNLTVSVLGGNVYSKEPIQCQNLDKSLTDGTVLVGLVAALVGGQFSSTVVEDMSRQIEGLIDGKNPHRFDLIFSKVRASALSPQQIRWIVTTSVAMATAEELLEIPLLVDAEDMVLSGDSNANLAYLSYFHNADLNTEKVAEKAAVLKSAGGSSDELVGVLKVGDGAGAGSTGSNVKTLDDFDPDAEYSDDIVLFL